MRKTIRFVQCLILAILSMAIGNRCLAQTLKWTQDSKSFPGYVINDLFMMGSTSQQIANSQSFINELFLETSRAGGVFQDPFGTATPPNSALFPTFPSLAFDTFVGVGSVTSGSSAGPPQIIGGAIDIGGQPPLTFDDRFLDVAWATAGGVLVSIAEPTFVARVTLADDASGAATVFSLINNDDGPFIADYQIVGGAIVPEPGSILLGLAAAIFLACGERRRR